MDHFFFFLAYKKLILKLNDHEILESSNLHSYEYNRILILSVLLLISRKKLILSIIALDEG